MSQQEKQQIEVEDDNSSIADDDFVRLEQTTPNNKVVQQQQQQLNGNGTNWNPLELSTSMAIDELKFKVAALETKNQMLEGKLEKLELKAQIHELKEEMYGHKLKEVEQKAVAQNQASMHEMGEIFEQKLQDLEQKAELANNRMKSTLLLIQQKMAEFELMGKECKCKANHNSKNQLPVQTDGSRPESSHLEHYYRLKETEHSANRARLQGQQLLNLGIAGTGTESSSGHGLTAATTISTNRQQQGMSKLCPLLHQHINGTASSSSKANHTQNCSPPNNDNGISLPNTQPSDGNAHSSTPQMSNEQFNILSLLALVGHPQNNEFGGQKPMPTMDGIGDKPYICNHVVPDGISCGKRFSQFEDLKTHQMTHTDDLPYKCAYCKKVRKETFTNASDKAKHQDRVHKCAKDYGCPVYECPKKYTDPSSLRKHVVHEHGETVWLFAKANREAKAKHFGVIGIRPEDYGVIGIRADGTPFAMTFNEPAVDDESDETASTSSLTSDLSISKD